ncbi:MAG: TonB-dependent receptor plug domain-containing protein [Holosporales bacterium]
MCTRLKRPLIILCGLLPQFLAANEEIVVRDTAVEEPTSTPDRLTAKEAQRTQTRTLSGTLNQMASITLSGSEHQGPLYARMRGANFDQTVVRFEGIPINSPLDSGAANLMGLPADLLGDVRAVAGSNSVSGGPGAIGGVINLQAFDASEERASLSVEAGSRHHTRAAARVHHQNHWAHLGAGLVSARSGQGHLQNRIHGQPLADRRHSTQGLVKAELTPISGARTKLLVMQDHQHQRLNRLGLQSDGQFYPHPHAAKDHLTTERLFAGLTQTLSSTNGRWKGCMGLGGNHVRRVSRIHGRRYRGTGEAVDTQTELKFRASKHIKLKGQAGLLSETIHVRHGSHNRRHIPFTAIVMTVKPVENLRTEGGLRADHLKNTGTIASKHAGLSWQALRDTTIGAQVGTGFRAPSLFDRAKFGTFQLPNRLIKPEKSHSYSLSLGQNLWHQQAQLMLTGFILDIDRLIATRKVSPFSVQRVNSGKRRSKGAEISLLLSPNDRLHWRTAYTLTQTRNHGPQPSPMRLPRHKVSSTLTWQWTDSLATFVATEARNRTLDLDYARYPVKIRKLHGRALLALGASWQPQDNIAFFGRIENLFNTRYEDQYGYGPGRRSIILGGSLKF